MTVRSQIRTNRAVGRCAGIELCWTLLGQHRGRIWCARRDQRALGEPYLVRFDGGRALRREERQHDVVGFWHTHPGMPAWPSNRDVRTMRAWTSCFGKPLLCVIAGADGLRGYRFDDDASAGVEMELVQAFPRGVIVAVD
jgi:proteasome lid subunit RPN8/RPN11